MESFTSYLSKSGKLPDGKYLIHFTLESNDEPIFIVSPKIIEIESPVTLELLSPGGSLSDLSKIETSADFIVSLNKKIDAYESKKEKGFRTFLDNIFSNNYLPKISIVAMSLVCVFGLMYFLDFNSKKSSSLILSNSSTTNDTSINNGVADLDSLEINLEVDK